ncbi:hypothetical protein Hdeb2414_s0005g00169761 [Helianthus debilis subsp. tardiflorus]
MVRRACFVFPISIISNLTATPTDNKIEFKQQITNFNYLLKFLGPLIILHMHILLISLYFINLSQITVW